jgi:FAD/FMN-containing dehydrogenase
MVQQAVKNVSGIAVDDSTVQAFAGRLRGKIVRPDNVSYDETRRIWNGMINKRPAMIVRCQGASDVMEAVKFAREHGVKASVRGGGHNIAGTSLCDDGMVIDLSPMKGIRVDLQNGTVHVQPGCTWADVDKETQKFGYAVPCGIISTTGVAGLALGGGFGWLSRKYGYTSDNLVSADVVTADGEFLKASDTENPELFWGIRGGGGNFGIVTSFEFRMRPVGPTVLAGMIVHPIAKATEVIDFFREFTSTAPNELTSLLNIRIAPPAPFLPKEVHGAPVIIIVVCYNGSVEDGEKVNAPLRKFGTPIADVIAPKPFTAHQTMLDSGQPSGRNYYWKSEYLHQISPDIASTILQNTSKLPSPESAFLMMHLGGAIGNVGENDTAAANRDARYIVNIAGAWDDTTKENACIQWARGFWSDMTRYSTGGVYVNFLTSDEGQDRVRAAYGPEKYDKLVAVKNKYDPTNFFQFNQNIKPSV